MKNDQSPRRPLCSGAAIAALALALTLLALWRTDLLTTSHTHFEFDGPHRSFVEMAQGGALTSPVGLPLLVRGLPIGAQAGFFLIAFCSVWMTGFAIFYLCRAMGFDEALSLIGMLLFFSMGWAVNAPLERLWCPDAVAGLSIVLAMLFTLRGFYTVAGVALLVGAEMSGTVLFAVPLLFTLPAMGASRSTAIIRGAISTYCAFGLWLALRIHFAPETSDGLWVHIERSAWQRWNDFGAAPVATLLRHTLIPLGAAVALLPLFGLRQSLRWAVRFSPFIAIVFLSLLVSDETERRIALLFPAMVPLALFGVRALRDRLGADRWTLMALPLALILLNLIDQYHPAASFQVQSLVFVGWVALIFARGRLTPRADCPTVSNSE